MPKTDASPLSIVQKQAEVTKKAVEKLLKECNKVIKDKKLKDKDVKQKQLFKECFQLKKDVISVHGRAEKLTKEDEPKKVKNYDNKKDFEVKRLANLQNQLTQIMPKLAPEEDEEAFTKELKEAGEISDSPVNEDEEEEDKEESEEEEDETDNAVNQGLEDITEEDESYISENKGEIKESPKDDKKDKEKKGKDKDKKNKDKKDKKDKDKKDKKKKDKKDKDDDDEDEEVDDKEIKEKDKKDAKIKDKKGKDKDNKKKKNKDDEEDEEEDDDDDDNENKYKDKKKFKDSKNHKEKEKDEKKKNKGKDETIKQEVQDLEEESEEDEDVEEAIEGDDEEDFEDTEDEEDDHAIIDNVKKQDTKQVKTSPKDETDNLKTMDYEEQESEEEEESEDDDDVEDIIQPEKANVIASTPKPASRALASNSESSKVSSSTTVMPSSSSFYKTESSNITSSTSQSKTPQPASRSSTSKTSSFTTKEVSKLESKKDEADHEDEEEEEESEEEEEEENESEEDEDGEDEESEEEEDDEEEEEDDEEEDTSKENNTLEVTQPIERFVAIDNFEAVEEGDLSVKKDEVIRILSVREDGWWVAENEAGKQGLVPRTFLKVYNQYESIQQQDDKEENDEQSDEDGEEKQDGEKTPTSKRRSGRELWGSVKKTVSETLVTDVLHAMGAGPPGFRLPTLSKYFNESEKFRMKNFLAPKLSESNLGYRDLYFNPATGEMRPIEVRLERLITITSCQQIPPPAAGIIVQRRYVRMCLFDGQNVLSNIHTVKVAAEDKTERNWSFNSKISDFMDIQLHNEFFIRSNSTHSNIGILFELGISCVKSVNEKTEEKGEFSCGWVHLPLTDKTGVPIANKHYDLYVHGGTPYERDVEVDPSVSRRASSNALVSLISGNKQPRLLVKVSVPNKEQKTQLDLLPEILVGDMCLLPFYTYYRQILADALVIKRLDLDSTEAIHSPFLRQFPEIADHPDLMSLFRETWVNKLKAVKRAEKRDIEAMKEIFDRVFKESVYPVITTGNFVPFKTGNTEIEMKRKNVIEKFSQIKRERKSALAALLASDIAYTPFDMSEVTFNIINPYSLADKFIPVPVES